MGERFQEHVADFLVTVAEALSIPPAGTDEGEPVWRWCSEATWTAHCPRRPPTSGTDLMSCGRRDTEGYAVA
jgi:hypothetical protein